MNHNNNLLVLSCKVFCKQNQASTDNIIQKRSLPNAACFRLLVAK